LNHFYILYFNYRFLNNPNMKCFFTIFLRKLSIILKIEYIIFKQNDEFFFLFEKSYAKISLLQIF
jgi:hypothetical protein